MTGLFQGAVASSLNKAGRYTETEEYLFDKGIRLLILPSSYWYRSLRHDSVRTKTTNI